MKHAEEILPAFLAARNSASFIRSCAGSVSGEEVMNESTMATASSFVKYCWSPSEHNIKNLSLGLSLWW